MTPTPQPESASAAPAPTVETRELITLCRQMGNMMEAGVDILRITRVLRSQTENPLLLEFYENFDHDLRLGRSVADAMANAPELFSPFAVSLVQEGEERHDIAGALFKIADFLQSEASIGEWAETGSAPESAAATGPAPATRQMAAGRRSVPAVDSGALAESLERLFDRTLRTLAILLLVESGIAAAVAAAILPVPWWPPLALLAAAGVCALMPAASRTPVPTGQESPTKQEPPPDSPANEPAVAMPVGANPVGSTPVGLNPVGANAGMRIPLEQAAPDVQTSGTVAPANAAGTSPGASEETKVVWPTAEEENAAYSKVWQRSAPQEEQYD